MIDQPGLYRIVERSGRRRVVRVGRLETIGWLIWIDGNEAGRVKDLDLIDVDRLGDTDQLELKWGE